MMIPQVTKERRDQRPVLATSSILTPLKAKNLFLEHLDTTWSAQGTETAEANLEPSWTSVMKFFVKKVNS